jgi:hypothetical protein
MAPNTRAASKRAQGLAKVKLLANDPNQKASASAVAKDVRCHLLELPPGTPTPLHRDSTQTNVD